MFQLELDELVFKGGFVSLSTSSSSDKSNSSEVGSGKYGQDGNDDIEDGNVVLATRQY